MQGLVGKVKLESGLIHFLNNYWTPSISQGCAIAPKKTDKVLVPTELAVWGQMIASRRGGMRTFIEALLCAKNYAEDFPCAISFDPYHHSMK